jgi:CDP-diacylglycerol--serine O-phosphatidyltransferase
MTGQDGAFGAELDSLSDVVSFGVAPAILMHRLVLGQPAVFDHGERLLWFAAVFFPVMAAIRLARYNVEASDTPSPWFRGLPSPGAAAVVCGWIILHQHNERFRTLAHSALKMDPAIYNGLGDLDPFRWFLIAISFVAALTMVSTIRFPHVGNTLLGRMAYRKLIGLLLMLVFFFVMPVIALVVTTTGYLLFGLSLGAIDFVRNLMAGRDPLGDDDDSEDAGLAPDKPGTGPAHGR